MPKLLADDVRRVRAERGCSIFEAVRVLVRAQHLKAVEEASSVDDLKTVVKDIVESIWGKEP